jgi:hypothetical protein
MKASESLVVKQAELAVLKQILEAQKAYRRTDNLSVESGPFIPGLSHESMMATQKMLQQREAIKDLARRGLIRILSLEGLEGIRISITGLKELTELHKELFESIPATGNFPRIVYSLKSGTGKIDGESFKLYRKSDNRKLLKKLLITPEHRLNRTDAWKAIGRREALTDADGVNEFSKVVSKLRAGLRGISKDCLVFKNNVIELKADIYLTD